MKTILEWFQEFCESQECLTYKKICTITNSPYYSGGDVKAKQIEYWKSIAEIEKNGTKYKFISMKVDKIDKKEYDSKLYYGRLNKLSKDNNRYDQFNISKENSHKGGVYKIQLDNKIYIGKTNNFQVRFRSHWDGTGRNKLTQELLFNGGIFSIIEILDGEDERIQKESIYIDKYKKDKNFICLNIQQNTNKEKNINKEKWINIKIKEKDLYLLEENKIEYRQKYINKSSKKFN